MLYIFDAGGVVLHDVFELSSILEAHGVQLEVSALYRDDLMAAYASGHIDEDEYWRGFNVKYGTDIAAPKWGLRFEPRLDIGMVGLIKELKRSHRVVCGTNTIAPHWCRSITRGDYDCFHAVYASHLMGCAKPDHRFWQYILEKENYGPEDTVFIDDFPENVRAAEMLGISSVLYEDIPTLRQALIPAV